jgi:hypothetical protein
MPADKPKRESEEAGTYRVIVGFYHTYSSDGRWIDPPLDVTYEHPFPSLSACMKGVKALDRYYKR